jgi:hypothetical protein
MRAALAAGVAALFLSGAVRGEVGRIAIPLMPALLVGAMAPAGDEAVDPAEAVLAGALLLALTAAIAARWAVA